MSRCWIEVDAMSKRPAGVLTSGEHRNALSFARLAQDIYPDQTGKDRGDASLVYNWVELLQTPKEKASGINLSALRTFMVKCFGFNAALYKLRRPGRDCWVLSFEGSGSIASVRGLPDWVLTNIPTTLSVGNYFEKFVPLGAFSRKLNPRNAPSTQYDIADLVTRQAIKLKGKADLILTGHSLGGGLAQYAAIHNGVRAIVFNSAGIGFKIPNLADAGTLNQSICHLMTTDDAGILRSLGQVVQGRVFQALGLTVAISNPLFQREAMTLYTVGSNLASQPKSSIDMVSALIGQHVNKMVTTYTKAASKQVGTQYILGYGGHKMHYIIDLLKKSGKGGTPSM